MKNANHIPTNGNCKKVRDITNNIRYGSFTEVAMKKGVTIASVSLAVKNGTLCKGCRLVLESELHKNPDLLCDQLAKANAREAKAYEKLSKMHELESEMAEFRKWKAEQEAARKAEEARLEKERKEKERVKKLVDTARSKVAKCGERVDKHKANIDAEELKLMQAEQDLMQAEIELEALLDQFGLDCIDFENGKEVI